MVTATEAGQLTGECSLWRDTLRSFRNRFVSHQSLLQKISARQFQKDALLKIEHLHNQFHIQLINIHDLKQAIKKHVLRITTERSERGYLTDDTQGRHEFLHDNYQRLDNMLHEISLEFDQFLNYVNQQCADASS